MINDEMLPLWTAADISQALGPLLQQPIAQCPDIAGISIDTRSLQAGDLFVALRGEQVDGHDYISAAFEAGAAAALVDHQPDGETETGALIIVSDVMAALEALGRAARARTPAYIIGVTGSVGKTSVKEALHAGLEKSGTVHVSEKSFNNHIGVPLSLARLPANTAYAVFEIGMNHAGEIEALVDMVRPHCAVITQIGEAHIEHFDSMEDLARAKAEILTGIEAGGAAILPQDSEYYDVLHAAAVENGVQNIVRFGLNMDDAASDVATTSKFKLHAECSCVSGHILGDAVTYKIGVPGAHLVSNSLAVLSAVSLAGADMALAALSLADHQGLSGRGKRHYLMSEQGDYVLIDETYNANPVSMAAALNALGLASREAHGRRIAVLGDMAELGADAVALHENLKQTIEQANVDLVFGCGPLTKHLMDVLPKGCRGPHAETPKALVKILKQEIHQGDVVMVKGSNASGMQRVIRGLRKAHQSTGSLQMLKEG